MNITKLNKMNKPAKPDKEKMDGINKTKPMNNENKKIMRISILIVVIVIFVTIFVFILFELDNIRSDPGIRAYLPHKPSSPNVIDQFTINTTNLFRDIAEIPALSEITPYVDSYNTLANILEINKAHKNTGRVVANPLRDFFHLLYEAEDNLRGMFVESKTVHYTFEIEVKSMIDKITARTYRIFMNSDFFKIRILKLEKAIMEFSIIVNNVMQKIMDIHQQNKVVSQRLLEAQVEAALYQIDSKKNFDLITEAINGVKIMKGYLNKTAAGLREVRGKLKDYELSMNKVKANLGVAEFELTNESLQHLKATIELWRESQTRFFSKQKKRV